MTGQNQKIFHSKWTCSWMVSLITIGILGGLSNRIRGGLLPYGGTINAILFGLIAGYFLSVACIIPAAVLMFVGQQFGWGRYIGALYGTEKEKLEEWTAIDWIVKSFKEDMFSWGYWGLSCRGMFWSSLLAMVYMKPIYLFIACILLAVLYMFNQRVFLIVALLLGVIAQPFVALIGMLMPSCYLLSRYIAKNDGRAWEGGEVIFGALLWMAVWAPTIYGY